MHTKPESDEPAVCDLRRGSPKLNAQEDLLDERRRQRTDEALRIGLGATFCAVVAFILAMAWRSSDDQDGGRWAYSLLAATLSATAGLVAIVLRQRRADPGGKR